MDTKPLCPSCQKPLAPDVRLGLCPECLIKAGFPTGKGSDTGSMTHQAFVPPAVEEIAGLFPQLEILELIGRGGMGAVYKARQRQLNRFVALKILPPGVGSEPAFAERFTREARALAQLNHPNIVTLYEFGETSGQFYFLMEFVDGVNLRQLLASSRVSPREALAIVPQICDALQFAHDQGIVHRDIKPENILLDRRGRVKVADFGLAKLVGVENDPRADGGIAVASPDLTVSGKIMGTPNYMAPEQVEHPTEVDHRADIYALGVVFYQMLTGELPGKKIEVPSKKVHIDVRLDEVVLRALEKKPELRYQQVSEVKTMVETIVAIEPGQIAPPAPVQPAVNTNAGIKKTKIRQSIILFSMIAILGVALAYEIIQRHKISQSLKPLEAQQLRESRQQSFGANFEKRLAQDQGKLTQAQLQEAEQLYQVANTNWGTPEAIQSLQTMIKKYPDCDRAGCATLYLAQMSNGDDRARYLQSCIDDYNDCYYGDGVQVGAFARFLLVQDYRSQGDDQKANVLSNEIKTKFAGAIDHQGNLLVDSLKTDSK